MSRKRIDECLSVAEEMLAAGQPAHVVARRVSEQFGVGLRQGQKYVERAIRRWSEIEIEERPRRKMLLRKKTQALFLRCYQTGQLAAAVRALELMGRLDGLFDNPVCLNDSNVQVESRYLAIKAMSPRERRERIRDLIVMAIRADPELAMAAREALSSSRQETQE